MYVHKEQKTGQRRKPVSPNLHAMPLGSIQIFYLDLEDLEHKNRSGVAQAEPKFASRGSTASSPGMPVLSTQGCQYSQLRVT